MRNTVPSPSTITDRMFRTIIKILTLTAFLALAGGCATKTVAPPAEFPPPSPEAKPSTSDILSAQYAKWANVSYKFGGTSTRGVDCSGLVRAVFQEGFEIDLPRTSIEQSRAGKPVPREALQTGDLVFFSDRKSDHIGVAMDTQRFLHASTSEGVTISELDKYWASRLARIIRILEAK